MQFPPYFGHKNDLGNVSLRFSCPFDWTGYFLLLFSFAVFSTLQLLFKFHTFIPELAWRRFFIRNLHDFIFDIQGLSLLALNLLLKVEEAVLYLLVSLLFGKDHRFLLVVRLAAREAAVVHDAWGLWEADIAGDARTVRIVWVWVECLREIEVLIVHGEELKAWCGDRFEDFGVENNHGLFVLGILFENLLVVLGEGVRFEDDISLIHGESFDPAKAFGLHNWFKLRHVEFAIVGGEALGG